MIQPIKQLKICQNLKKKNNIFKILIKINIQSTKKLILLTPNTIKTFIYLQQAFIKISIF